MWMFETHHFYKIRPSKFIPKLGPTLFIDPSVWLSQDGQNQMKTRVENNVNVINKICFFNTSTVSARRLIRAECAAQLKAARFVFDQSGASLLCADQSELAVPQLRPITRRLCIFFSQWQRSQLPQNHEQNQSKTFAGCFRLTNVLREEFFSWQSAIAGSRRLWYNPINICMCALVWSIPIAMPCVYRELKKFSLQKLLRDGIAYMCDFKRGENHQKLHFLALFGFSATQPPSGAWGACCLPCLGTGLREMAHWEVRFQFKKVFLHQWPFQGT